MDNRDEVREFLMSRRAKTSPTEAGLPAGTNRRVPGLRRSEVAMLAGVSVEYYSRLERGAISGASSSVLDAISRALQFDDAETAHQDLLAMNALGRVFYAPVVGDGGRTPDRDGTVTQGGYSTHVVVDEDFVLRVPESIPYEAAAPLLCAGITTYSPLRHWGAAPGKKVAVVGMGGLGHLAVKLAHAMGAHVTVLSQTLGKKDDGLRFGADDYFATSDPQTFETLANTFDLILNTVSSAELDFDAYLSLLRLDGSFVNVGAPAEPVSFQVFTLFGNRRSFGGSGIGSIAETQEMLDFCAENGIATEVEVISADQINDAYERVLRSDVRYRFVIDTTSLGGAAS
ncbi:helix-turn-helix domain-containing protein [Labedella phragmitis]|uniref:alcohol dehydrogenase (NADP(+)) n=1 Tax=Labedella phragmitis TaxID=2498849 RepID=A0A444PTG5_9MICO|nr:zinc-binding dehydrogenase [Labedella phragmitis]RWZ51158.1 helix-turn-helix domain-containing protein [Labedella phragmitis]